MGMDIFASGENIADMIMTADEEQKAAEPSRVGIRQTVSRISVTHCVAFTENAKSLVSVSEELNCSRQAIQRRHERAIRKLRRYLTTDFNKIQVH